MMNFKISNDTSLIRPKIVKKRKKKIVCSECNKKRVPLDESHQICQVCYKYKSNPISKLSGNKTIDDFIRYTQTNYITNREGKMEFVPYEQFKNTEFIAEGGFSKIYKATWIERNRTVVLKKLNNSKNITYKELNEVRTIIYYSNFTILRLIS
jgi:hypothetical protein